MKRIDEENGKVIDLGDILGNGDGMLKYVIINKYINTYIEEIVEFIIDLNKDFEIKEISQKNNYEKNKIIKIPSFSESNILFLIHNLSLGFGFDYFKNTTFKHYNIFNYIWICYEESKYGKNSIKK